MGESIAAALGGAGTMKSRHSKKNEPSAIRPPSNRPTHLGAFALKLERAFQEIAAGQVSVRRVEVPDPHQYRPNDVRRLRRELGVSQSVFAQLMGVSTVLVQSWEQGQRIPSRMARRLLEEIAREPRRWASVMKPVA
jgi:putative transcriptional regulator